MPYLFVFLSAFLFYGIVLCMPKRLSRSELYTTSLFAVLFNALVDVYLDLRLDWYGYFNKGADYQMGLVLIGIFPPVSMIFLNGFPFGRPLLAKIGYIGLCTLGSVFYEWLSVHSGLLYYRTWTLWYSALCYPVIQVVTVLNLVLIRTLSRARRSEDGPARRR